MLTLVEPVNDVWLKFAAMACLWVAKHDDGNTTGDVVPAIVPHKKPVGIVPASQAAVRRLGDSITAGLSTCPGASYETHDGSNNTTKCQYTLSLSYDLDPTFCKSISCEVQY